MSIFTRDPFADLRPLIDGVYGYVAYRIGAGPDAEDVTSATFERAFRYRKTYDASKGEPLGWLIGIARRCISDRARISVTDMAPPDVADRGDLADDAVRRIALAAALRSLDDRDRELLALRYGADLSASQIGRVAGMKPGAVRVALKRARERLAAAMEEDPRDEVPQRLSVRL